MKKQGHPQYQEVLFVDSSTGYKFVCGSTMKPKETEVFEGKTYPVCRLPISSASHPFFNKTTQLLDTEGRVDRFTKRYAAKRQEQVAAVAAKEEEKEEKKKKQKKK